MVRQVFHGTDKTERRRRIAWIKLGRDNRAGPSPDARQNSHILLAIRPDIRDGLSYDSGIGLKIPEHLSRFRVHRFEVAVHGSVEGDVSRGDDGPTPGGEVFLDAPDF